MTFAEDISAALDTLRKGGIIIYPTDTVWGIGCDATDNKAVSRIFAIKQRPDSKALISLVASVPMLERWVDDIPEVAYGLIDTAVRPLTIIYDHPKGFAPSLLAPDGSAALRVASDNFCRELCQRFRKPIVSTSANIAGHPAPDSFRSIDPRILTQADYVAATGRDNPPCHTPSNIIKLSSGGIFTIIR